MIALGPGGFSEGALKADAAGVLCAHSTGVRCCAFIPL